jgi:outer membrane lipopolysaccharide assembly protein LptE/RlpB
LSSVARRWGLWIPAYAGMTILVFLTSCGFELRGDTEVGIRKLFI